MKLIAFIVTSALISFSFMGNQLRLTVNVNLRLRRREQISVLHKIAAASRASLKKTSQTIESIFRNCHPTAHFNAILASFFRAVSVSFPRIDGGREDHFFSALLDPPLVPPPKA